MDFQFTDDQQDLIDAAKAVFDGENTVERMRAMAAGKETSSLWPQLTELGLFGVMAPENLGGLEQPLTVMAGIAEASGYAGVPEPLIEIAGITVPLLVEMGEPDLVKAVLGGVTPIGFLTPLVPNVPFGNFCEKFVVTRTAGGALIPKDGVNLEALKSIDPLRSIFKASVTGDQNPDTDQRGAVLCAAQLIGLSHRMVDMSVEYAKDRHQFSKPIGSFQAVKHQLANVYTQIEFTRPMMHLAAIKGGVAVHNAKVAAIDTAMLAAETAIQVHGGMGYTYEVDLHLFMKRAWALCGEWGDRNYHMKKLEDYVLNGAAELGPDHTFRG